MGLLLESSKRVVNTAAHVGAAGTQGKGLRIASNEQWMVKKFHDPAEAAKLEDKIRYLISRPLIPSFASHQYAWPVDLVIDTDTRSVVGYAMPVQENGVELANILQANFWLPAQFLARAAISFVRSLMDLHNAGYCRGDMPNAVVLPDASITEVDIDSLQVAHAGRTFRCGYAKPGYCPAELIGEDLSQIDMTVAHDLFGIAVIIWQLVRRNGLEHPFAAQYIGPPCPPDRRDDRIKQGIWAWSGDHADYAPPRNSPPLSTLPRGLRDCFIATFRDGHHAPSARTSLGTWLRELSDYERTL
ncbi:MAG: hypothetical protein KDA60_00820 [Planctomycetales bacterium]|nr:hypothetical protein [Planctomycetales bacterium]